MKQSLLRNVSLFARNRLLPSQTSNSITNHSHLPLAALTRSRLGLSLRLFSSDNGSSDGNPNPEPVADSIQPHNKDVSLELQDVSNKGKTINSEQSCCLVAENMGKVLFWSEGFFFFKIMKSYETVKFFGFRLLLLGFNRNVDPKWYCLWEMWNFNNEAEKLFGFFDIWVKKT